MFQKNELKRLQAQKELLVLQSSANRLLLSAECQELRSPEHWRGEVERLARRHPMLLAALTAAGGVFAAQAIRQPVAATGKVGRLTRLASMAFTLWRIFRADKRE
jgi:hypothetical protein